MGSAVLDTPPAAPADARGGTAGVPGPGVPAVAALSDAALQSELSAAFAERRRVDASIARLSGEVVCRSRASLGPGGLARRNGSNDAAGMVGEIGRITRAEAARLCRVGDATASRWSLTGDMLPPTFESSPQRSAPVSYRSTRFTTS